MLLNCLDEKTGLEDSTGTKAEETKEIQKTKVARSTEFLEEPAQQTGSDSWWR